MDPLTASTAFATIVGLICNFRSERGARELVDHRDFVEWLEQHRHEEIKDLICKTYHLQSEVDRLLREDYATILSAVNRGNQLLTDVLSRLDSFAPLAESLSPTRNLSDQAIFILRQLRGSGAPEVGLQKFIGGFRLIPFSYGSSGAQFELSEPLLAEDDLKTMVELGLLRLRVTERGSEFFGITRAAVLLLDILAKTSETQQAASEQPVPAT